MDWRTYIFQIVTNDALLNAIVPADSWFGAGSLTGAPDKRPFGVIRMNEPFPTGVANTTRQTASIYVHDDAGDYLKIDAAMLALREALVGVVTMQGGFEIQWQGDSADLSDDTYSTITKYATFQLVGRD